MILTTILLGLATLRPNILIGDAPQVPAENEYYTIEHFPAPDGARLEVGAMGLLPSGELALSTRRGQVWILENPEVEDVSAARWRLFTEGLREGMGLAIVDGDIHVVQRGELSRLRDTDADGYCDQVQTICNSWGLSGNYHEFAFGLPRDEAGNFFVTLNVSFFSPKWWHGKSPVPYRGWALRISPEGEATPWAHGFRSPCGVGQNALGEVFVTDNQGDWCASSPIYHLVEGGFYGHPASLEWTSAYRDSGTLASDEVPPAAAANRRPAAVWIPYDWSRSTGNLVHDSTNGRFGPFGNDLFVAELTNGMVLRSNMEKVQGEYQGWVQPFRQGIGSVARVLFSPQGTLFCGMTNRGWGGRPPADGLARVRWTGRTPFELASIQLLQSGFSLKLTQPLAEGLELNAESASVYQYDYNYWWEYGSDPQNHTDVTVTAVEVSEDRMHVIVHAEALTPAMVARVKLHGLVNDSGTALLHPEFAYTINQLPEGPLTREHVSKIVPPPPSKESGQEGWLMLSWGNPMDRFDYEGWGLVGADIDRDDPTRFAIREGNSALVNVGPNSSSYSSKNQFGDCEVHLGFMLPKNGRSGLLLMGRYELQLIDVEHGVDTGLALCGSIAKSPKFSGAVPSFNAYRTAGEWHELDVRFRAPRFGKNGKVQDARIERVIMDGRTILKDIDLPEPSVRSQFTQEAALGPLMILGDLGPVAIRDIRVKPSHSGRGEALACNAGAAWNPVFPDEEFDEWVLRGEAQWDLDDVTLISGGRRGHLLSTRSDYSNFDLRGRIKISDGGNSGLILRATQTPEGVVGYEAEINSTFPGQEKTGSLVGVSPVEAQLIPANTWFDYFISVREETAGTRVRVWVNGIAVTDYLDTEREHGSGHIAIVQNHEGSVTSIENLQVRVCE